MNSLMHFLEGSFVEALGWTLVHSLWQGALVMIILAVILGLTQGKNAHARYGFATAALMLMLVWSGVTFMSYYSNPTPELTWDKVVEAPIPPEAVAIGPMITIESPVAPLEASIWSLAYWTNKLEGFMHTNSPLIAAFWLFGSMLFFLKWIGSLIYIHRIRRTAILQVSTDWQNRLDNIAKRMGILKSVQLVESIRVNTPMVVGHFKPLILVPAGLLTGMSPEQIETILIHELAHIRRNDYVINLIQSVLEIIYFYHPAYWWIADKIKQEREHCCDDIAVAVCGDAMLYARALTEVQARKYEAAPALAMAATGKKNHLMNRVKRILLPTQERGNMTGKVILSFILLLSVWSFAWVEEVPKVNASDLLTTPIDLTEVPLPSDVVVPFLVPHVTAPGFEAPDEVPFPDFVPEPVEIPRWDEWDIVVAPEEIPETYAFSAPFVDPEIAEVIPENFDFRFNFDFPEAATSFQQFFEFSFAFTDSPKPYLYKVQPLPNMPAIPALPDVSWQNEEARKAYKEALKLYEYERRRIIEEQARIYEEVQRMQESYTQVYEEKAQDDIALRKLEKELMYQQNLAQIAARQAEEAKIRALRGKKDFEEGRINNDDLAKLRKEALTIERGAVIEKRKTEMALLELKQKVDRLANIESQRDLRGLEREVNELRKVEELRQREAEIAQKQALQNQYEEVRRRQADMQRLADDLQMREAEKQMRLMEEQMKMQEEQMRKQEREMNQHVEKMGRALKSELIKDGYIDSYDDSLYINIKNDYMKVNGEKMKDRHYKKYLKIINDHDLHFGKGSDFTIQF